MAHSYTDPFAEWREWNSEEEEDEDEEADEKEEEDLEGRRGQVDDDHEDHGISKCAREKINDAYDTVGSIVACSDVIKEELSAGTHCSAPATDADHQGLPDERPGSGTQRSGECCQAEKSANDTDDCAERQAEEHAVRTKALAAERDAAAKRILARSSRTLADALNLADAANEAELQRAVRRLLRLLHPDYTINRTIKGSKKHQYIDAAYKRLNGLRTGQV